LYLVTLIGPLYHIYIATPRENALLAAYANNELVGDDSKPSTGDAGVFKSKLFPGCEVFYRWTASTGSRPKAVPVALPNGLGANAITTCFFHDGFAARGFNVLSYDRPGVGLSPAFKLTPAEHVDVMAELMEHVAPGAAFLLFAGSFGNTVAQLFTARHPNQTACVFNLDGLPCAFQQRVVVALCVCATH